MKIAVISQARMTSSRLPGKVMKQVLGKPLMAYQVERLRRMRIPHEFVIATTDRPTDDEFADYCQSKLGASVFRGDERDVLSRYDGAASACGADVIVRVTSDCPLIDPAVTERVIRTFVEADGKWDYVSNTLERRFPRGLDTEVFTREGLAVANREATLDYEREHVTPFFYRRPERFRIHQVLQEEDHSALRWTVDTPEDFQLVEAMLTALYPVNPAFTQEDALRAWRQHPQWATLNAHIEQKKLGE